MPVKRNERLARVNLESRNITSKLRLLERRSISASLTLFSSKYVQWTKVYRRKVVNGKVRIAVSYMYLII